MIAIVLALMSHSLPWFYHTFSPFGKLTLVAGFWPTLARRAIQHLKQLSIARMRLDGFAMLPARCLIENRQGADKERFSAFRLAARLIELRQADKAAGHMWMHWPVPLFSNLQSTQEE